MRLIDADKLSPTDKVVTVKSTGEKCVYQRTDNAPTVKAIPIEWIKKWEQKEENYYLFKDLTRKLIEEWEKENQSLE